jgi:hypothetical protein
MEKGPIIPDQGHLSGACLGWGNDSTGGRQNSTNFSLSPPQDLKAVEGLFGSDRLLQDLDPRVCRSGLTPISSP